MSSEKLDLEKIKRASVLVHPKSTTSKIGQKKFAALKAANPNIEFLREETSINRDTTRSIIAALLKECDLLIGIHGDGTFNDVCDAILNRPELSEQAKRTPFLSLGGGYAEDGYKAKHPRYYRNHPDEVLPNAHIIDTYPIRFDITHPISGEQQVRSAGFYATLGVTALASNDQYFGKPEHRNSFLFGRNRLGRWLSEPPIALRALKNAQTNRVRQNGEVKEFLDWQFVNTDRMARRFKYPTSLARPELFTTAIAEKKTGQLALFIGQLVTDRIENNGMYITPGDSVEFDTLNDIWAQFDGEATLIDRGSHVAVSIHDQAMRLVTTNPALFEAEPLAA